MWVVRDGPVGKPSWGVGDVLLTRREFIRSSAVVGAVGSVGGFSLLGCHGGAHWQAPESIDNTGATDVSAALTNWLASTGAPGDAFELRRRPDGSPGRYWVPRGVRIGKPMLFDMKGCELFTGLTLGVHDPNLEASIAAHPPLWNDSGEQTGPDGSWPTHRVVLLISSSNVTLHSSVENARIQGSARDVGYRGDEQLVGRRHPTGCIFHRRDERPPYAFGDGQHGIRLGGSAGTHSDTNHYSAILLDLTNISVEFVHGDGVYLNDNHDHVTIRGRLVGEQWLGGVPGGDDQHLAGHSLAGGDIAQGATRSDDRWVPWNGQAGKPVLPGIHHTGRQGIATDFRARDALIENLSIWRNGRSGIDWEPAAFFSVIERVTMRNLEIGIHTLLMMACAGGGDPNPPSVGGGAINDVVLEDVVSYELPVIDTNAPGGSLESRCHNWRIENVRCPTGLKSRAGSVFTLPRIDGLQILGNHFLIKGTTDGIVTNTGSPPTHPNRASTGVVIDPPEPEQAVFSP
jgi:hypothetical protein